MDDCVKCDSVIIQEVKIPFEVNVNFIGLTKPNQKHTFDNERTHYQKTIASIEYNVTKDDVILGDENDDQMMNLQ